MFIRDVRAEERSALGLLLVDAYSQLEGFPTPEQQPDYYRMLANVGDFTVRRGARVIVAVSLAGRILGGVVYFADMREYGSGGAATSQTNASGMRLLGVDPRSRGRGVGRALSMFCMDLARAAGHEHMILHTTQPMQAAWALYQSLGFCRAQDLDFDQQGLAVFGFRLRL